jgi:hypothetical protein
MILLAVISLLVGAVLAQRFKVMVLVPATAFVLITAVGTGFVQIHAVSWTILTAAAGVASMQLGYVVGLGIRCILEAPSSEAPRSFRPSASSARHPAS